MAAADAVVLGRPTYRGSFSRLLRSLLEKTQRGRYGETSAPLRGTAAAVVMTGRVRGALPVDARLGIQRLDARAPTLPTS